MADMLLPSRARLGIQAGQAEPAHQGQRGFAETGHARSRPVLERQGDSGRFRRLEDLPIGYWPIVIMDDIHESGAAGIHLDRNGQPFALVTASDRLDVWSLTCSHELIEMLVDPFGNRLVAGDSPKADQGRAQFLVEACDPSEDAQFAYTVNGVVVSDFYRSASSTRSPPRASAIPSPARSSVRGKCCAEVT